MTGTIIMALSIKTVLLRCNATPVLWESSNLTYTIFVTGADTAPSGELKYKVNELLSR